MRKAARAPHRRPHTAYRNDEGLAKSSLIAASKRLDGSPSTARLSAPLDILARVEGRISICFVIWRGEMRHVMQICRTAAMRENDAIAALARGND